MQINEETVKYIEGLVPKINEESSVQLAPSHTIGVPRWYSLRIKIRDEIYWIEFPFEVIDDFDAALKGYRDTLYFYTLESHIKFKIYIELGKEGALTQFRISDEILNEKAEWVETININVVFEKKMTEALVFGLSYILDLLNAILKKHEDLPLDDLEQLKEIVGNLIQSYENNKHLNSEGVGTESLQLLKASAVTKIMQLEQRKARAKITKIQQAFDKEIYYIVERLREKPFLSIKLPDFITTVKESFFVTDKDSKLQATGSVPQVIVNDKMLSQSTPRSTERYDVAFSLAHEQHEYVDQIYIELKQIAPHLSIFYYRDEGQKINFWGRNMVTYLQKVYRDLSDHVIIFVSSDYIKKRWAAHEWRSVQEAILDRPDEYVLPARFDDTKLEGLHETIAYIDLKGLTAKEFAEIIASKLSSLNQ